MIAIPNQFSLNNLPKNQLQFAKSTFFFSNQIQIAIWTQIKYSNDESFFFFTFFQKILINQVTQFENTGSNLKIKFSIWFQIAVFLTLATAFIRINQKVLVRALIWKERSAGTTFCTLGRCEIFLCAPRRWEVSFICASVLSYSGYCKADLAGFSCTNELKLLTFYFIKLHAAYYCLLISPFKSMGSSHCGPSSTFHRPSLQLIKFLWSWLLDPSFLPLFGLPFRFSPILERDTLAAVYSAQSLNPPTFLSIPFAIHSAKLPLIIRYAI